MNDAQLGAELALRAGGIDLPETVFPETATDREQRVVVEDGQAILGALRQAGALEVAGNLAGMGFENAAHLGHARGLFLEQDLASDGFDLDVGQRHADGETVEQLVELRHVGERTLAGAHDDEMAVHLLGHGLGDLGHQRGTNVGVTNVLLHLVEDQDGARHAPVLADAQQGFLGGLEEGLRGDVGGLRRELGAQGLKHVGLGGGELGVAGENGAGKGAADVEVVEFAGEVLAGRGDALLDLGIPALRFEPEAELGLRVERRQAGGLEQDGEDRETHVLRGAAGQSAGCGEQAAGALAGGFQLTEERVQIIRDVGHEAASRGAVVEGRILPQAGRHLEGMGFAAAVEAADPDALLAGAAEVFQKRPQDADQAVGELALADEGRQLAPQFLARLGIGHVGDARLALVDQGIFRGIALEDVVNLHGVNSSE